MSDLYKRIEELCKGQGITITEMCRRAGVLRANLTELKMGRQQTLGVNSLERIAKYFNVPVGSLVRAEENETAPAAEAGAVSEEDLKFALFGGDQEITDEMYNEVLQFAQFVKNKNKK